MYSADTSSLIAYFRGASELDCQLIRDGLEQNSLYLSAVVVTEVLSDPKLPRDLAHYISELPRLELTVGFWERAAKNRARLIQRKLKARLADTLIAQNCIDSGFTLIARDGDYRHFLKHCGLKLVMASES